MWLALYAFLTISCVHGFGPRAEQVRVSKWVSTAVASLVITVGSMDASGLHLNIAAASANSAVTSVMEVQNEQQPYEQSGRWEQSRQKRTVAIKAMAQKGMLKVNTDDSGNQFLSLPWIPNRKVPYKTLSLEQRLVNEVCAGAFGEISKDVLLHPVDTAKTRRQAKKKLVLPQVAGGNETVAAVPAEMEEPVFSSPLEKVKDMYSGFPVVLASSIPQGGMFFLVKKTIIEGIAYVNPAWTTSIVGQAVPIGIAVMAYWLFRTPAEVLKTQVQTRQIATIPLAIEQAKIKNPNGVLGLWKYYPVMLCLDIPFQIVNFILFGSLSEVVSNAGYASSIWTRLFCGTTCGMISAGLTCPIDVCKTRIISRDKAAQEAAFQKLLASQSTRNASSGGEACMGNGATVFLVEEGSSSSTSSFDASDGDAVAVAGADGSAASNEDAADGTTNNSNVLVELTKIAKDEGIGALFLGLRPRLVYTGLANGIRLAAYGTSRMDLMMRSLDDL